jgi:hypothetical protein
MRDSARGLPVRPRARARRQRCRRARGGRLGLGDSESLNLNTADVQVIPRRRAGPGATLMSWARLIKPERDIGHRM